jgi:hypothetical protein
MLGRPSMIELVGFRTAAERQDWANDEHVSLTSSCIFHSLSA